MNDEPLMEPEDCMWHELTEEAREDYRRQVAAMLLNGMLHSRSRWFWDALQDIGRDWIKRNAPDLLKPKTENPFA